MDALFALIKSMEPNEKRYFKMRASVQSGKEKSDYVQLFNILDKQKTYSEEKLNKKFGKGKNLSAVKNYLYNYLLDILQSYHSEKNTRLKLLNLSQKLEVLMSRGLYDQAKKIIDKIKRISEEQEEYLLSILALESEIKIFGKNAAADYFLNLSPAVEASLEKLEIVSIDKKLSALTFKLLRFYIQKQRVRTETDIQEIKSLIESLKALNIEQLNSYSLKSRHYDFLGIGYGILKDSSNAIKNKRLSIEHMETNPDKILAEPNRYMSKLVNLTKEYIKIKDWETSESCIEKMHKLINALPSNKNLAQQYHLITKSINTTLYLFLMSGGFERIIHQIPKIQAQLKPLEKYYNPRFQFDFYYIFAYSYFATAQYETSLSWIEKMQEVDETILSQVAKNALRVLQIINHFELQNFRLLPSLTRSFHRYLQKLEDTYQTEEQIITLIQNGAQNNQWKQYLSIFKALKSNSSESIFFEYFDVVCWIESKIKNQPFAEIYRQNILE